MSVRTGTVEMKPLAPKWGRTLAGGYTFGASPTGADDGAAAAAAAAPSLFVPIATVAVTPAAALGGAIFGFGADAAGASGFAADFVGTAFALRAGAFAAAFAEGFAAEVADAVEGVAREGRVAGVLRCIDAFAGCSVTGGDAEKGPFGYHHSVPRVNTT
jgi:hypothetical protein